MLTLTGQLLLLCQDPDLERIRTRITLVAADLEEIGNVPAVRKQLGLIQEIQSDDHWQDATPEMVEEIRRGLRVLVQPIEPKKRDVVITDFADEIGTGEEIMIPEVTPGEGTGRFRMKARQFLDRHADHIAILKLRRAEQLTRRDLSEIEGMMREEGGWAAGDADRALVEGGLGAFLRSLVGFDRKAAKAAFSDILATASLSAAQIEFIDPIIDHLVENGPVDASRFRESPFTDIDEGGLMAVFPSEVGQRIITVVRHIAATAAA